MFDRENAVGLLLLGLCAVAGGVLIWSTVTETRLRYTGPGWLAVVIMVVFIGGSIYGVTRGGGRGGRWPDPRTGGRRRRWPWRRGNDGS